MDFRSDNTAPAAPEILAALAQANTGTASAYGDDDWSRQLDAAFSNLFGTPCMVFPVATGTAANALALSALSPGYGAVFCHESSHIQVDECNAPEFFTGGSKLVPLAGGDGRIAPDALRAALDMGWRGVQHHPQPAALSLTQATECGTIYRPDQIAALAAMAKAEGAGVHMDGARFANAVAASNLAPADLTWKSGVDVLSFGATKNGAMAAEAVVFFDTALADDFLFRRKRAGHLFSKMRFLSAQLLAMLEGDLWLRLARQANQAAAELARELAALPGVRLEYPVEANEVFVRWPAQLRDALLAEGFRFYPWSADGAVCRLVCAFSTRAEDVAALTKAAARLVSAR